VVFTTTLFVFYFLPIVVAGYFALPRRARNAFLVVASYVFYGWWDPWFVLLMFGTTLVDYLCGAAIAATGASPRQRKLGVATSVVTNLGLLAFFKYSALGTESANALLALFGRGPFALHAMALPVGISFYTFQSMSYPIDLYRREAEPARSLVDFMAYVSLFPQLVAGPIVRYRQVARELVERRETVDRIARGASYFALGLAKKILLANPMGDIADATFAAGSPPWAMAWFGVVAYGWQIYFDFSGYSDMAIGLGLVFGFEFPQNFDAPYRSESITDFWRRWHISLSTWLRDYLYRPLGGNRKGAARTYVNLLVTMALGGLWHGAEWRYVIWGSAHGLALALERSTKSRCLYGFLPKPGRIAVTFVILQFNWVLFRSESVTAALHYCGSLFGRYPVDAGARLLAARIFDPFHLAVFAICAIVALTRMRAQDFVDAAQREAYRVPARACMLVGLLVWSFAEMWGQSANPFLYFQF
jgi:alginate O-acetyltransferase complex protein AlgI